MISKKIVKYLEKSKIGFEEVKHKTVYTSRDKANTLKIKSSIICKTLLMKGGRDYFVSAIPGDRILDKLKLKKVINKKRKETGLKVIKDLDFAKELWMKKNLKGIKIGSMPPFGGLFGMPTFLDESLADAKVVVVNGGNYKTSVKLTLKALKIIEPSIVIGSFSKKK